MKYLFVPLRQRREHSHTHLRMVSPAQGLATARDFFISQTALDTCRKMCPPRERRGTPIEKIFKVQKRDGLLPGNERLSLAETSGKEYVLAHVHRGKETVVLEDEADAASFGRKAHAPGGVVEDPVSDRKASGVGRGETRHEVGERRLPRAASPEHRRKTAHREASRQVKGGTSFKALLIVELDHGRASQEADMRIFTS